MKNFTNIRVLLISSNFCRKNESPDAYGTSCLATAFKTSNANVNDSIDILTCDLNRFHDAETDCFNVDWNLIADEIEENVFKRKYNVVAFSVFGWFEKAVKIACHRIKQRNKNIFIMLGGPSIFETEKRLKTIFPKADLFNLGYGEKVFAHLKFYINSAKRCINEPPKFENLVSPYLFGEIQIDSNINSVRVETRRGCPFRCGFCKHRDSLSGTVHHVGTSERFHKELQLFKSKGIKRLNIIDPLFNDYQGFGKAYLRKIRQIGFDGTVTLQIRPEFLVQQFLEEASLNPKIVFEIGVQSLDAKVLPTIQRGSKKTESQLREKLSICRDLKITTEITLIYGLPNQTYDSFARDIEILKGYNVSKISAFPLQIYAGTKIAEDFKKFNLSVKENYLGILEVIENPSHDFEKMRNLELIPK